jgi:hypothetical protein
MGITIKSATSTFEKSKVLTSLTLPNRSGLVSEFVLGGTQASSIINHASPSTPLTVTGTPTYNPNSVVTATGGYGSNYFTESKNVTTGDFTIISVQKKPTSANAGIAAAQLTGFGDYAGSDIYNSSSGVAPNIASLAFPTHGNFFFRAATAPLAGKAKMFLYTAGIVASIEATANGGIPRPASPVIIGTGYASGIMEVAFYAMYSRILSDAEIAAAYASLKAYYAYKGITVS